MRLENLDTISDFRKYMKENNINPYNSLKLYREIQIYFAVYFVIIWSGFYIYVNFLSTDIAIGRSLLMPIVFFLTTTGIAGYIYFKKFMKQAIVDHIKEEQKR